MAGLKGKCCANVPIWPVTKMFFDKNLIGEFFTNDRGEGTSRFAAGDVKGGTVVPGVDGRNSGPGMYKTM